MKHNAKNLINAGVATALLALSAPAGAIEKPQTMEDMWKVIQAQQQQIDAMKAAMDKAAPTTASRGASNSTRHNRRGTCT